MKYPPSSVFNHIHSRTSIYVCALIIIIIVGLSGIQESGEVPKKRIVRVGVFPAAPLVFVNDGKPDGLFINLIEYFASTLDWKIEYVEDSWENLLLRLEKGEIDLLPAVGYNDDRIKKFDFTRNPVFIDSGVVYTNPEIPLHTVFDLQNKKVAAVKGSVFTKGFIDYISLFGVKCDMIYTRDNPAVMSAIEKGQADAGVCIYSLGSELSKHYNVEITPINFSPVALEFAVPKGKNADIVKSVDLLLSPMIADKNSVYTRLFDKWMKTPASKEIPLWIIWIIGGTLFAGLFLGLYNISLKKQVALKTRNLLDEIDERIKTEEKLKSLLSEKETLLRELYHRTMNTMQIIRSMMELQSADFPENKAIRKIVKDTTDRIRAISLVHQMLYSSHDLSRISINDYVRKLIPLIMQSFGISGNRIKADFHVSEGHFLIDTAIPIGLVLNELITNSLKYAFPGNRSGNIVISIGMDSPEKCHLTYSDDGIGVPDGFDFEKQGTLGLKLIYNICKFQMHGTASFQNKNGIHFHAELSTSLYFPRV